MVFLVAQQNVVEQGAVRWEESARHLKRLRVPKLRVFGFGDNIEVFNF